MKKLIDFDVYPQSMRKYGGSDKKTSIIMNGENYMLKFNDKIDSGKRNELNSSYRNSVLSEYLSCHIIELLGVDVQETELGYRNGKFAVACKDFCKNGFVLNEFGKYQNAIEFDGPQKRYADIYDVMKIIQKDPFLPKNAAIKRFWDTFVIDAFLGNFDRHTGNWGYLVNEDEKKVILAPVYDCGACLYPMVSDDGIKSILSDEEKINERIFDFPKSAFSLDGHRLDYHTSLNSGQFIAEDMALLRIVPRVDFSKINEILSETPEIYPLRQDFYKTMLEQRFEKILQPAFLLAKERVSEKIGCKENQVVDIVQDAEKLENGLIDLASIVLNNEIRAKQICQTLNMFYDNGLGESRIYEKDL